MRKLSIEELQEQLNYSDLRAVRNWCKKNDVLLIKHGKSEFVYEANLKMVFEKPFISWLKSRLGNDWEHAYRLFDEENIPALNTLQEIPSITYKAYKSNSTMKNQFLEKLDGYKKSSAA